MPEVALVGRSNVGKSSLLNALVGRRRLAHVSRTPGKTRLFNVYAVGGSLYVVDPPGYGYARMARTERARWRRRLERYLRDRPTLRGVVWLLDIRREPSVDDRWMADLLAQTDRPMLAAATKADKLGIEQRRARGTAILEALGLDADQLILTSAVTREGIDELARAVERLA